MGIMVTFDAYLYGDVAAAGVGAVNASHMNAKFQLSDWYSFGKFFENIASCRRSRFVSLVSRIWASNKCGQLLRIPK